MPTCCVPNCRMLSSAQLKRLNCVGIKNLSYFLIPKNSNLRQKWAEILCITKRANEKKFLRVCELHFKETDVIRYDIIKLKNGVIYKNKYGRSKLRPESVPLPSPREIESLICTYEQKDLSEENIHENKQTEKKPFGESNGIKNITYEDNINPPTNASQPKAAESTHEYDNSLMERVYTISTGNASESNNSFDVVSFEDMNESQFELVESDTNSDTNTDIFINNVKIIESLKIPQYWAYVLLNDGSLRFTYVHPWRHIVYLSCIINSDMSVEIVAMNKKVKKKSDIKLRSVQNVIDYLVQLQGYKCCEGLGINNVFSNKCEGFVTIDKLRSVRCEPCKLQRLHILKQKLYKDKIDTDIRKKNDEIQYLYDQIAALQKEMNLIDE